MLIVVALKPMGIIQLNIMIYWQVLIMQQLSYVAEFCDALESLPCLPGASSEIILAWM
jgi:hypothetical protein